MTRGLRPASRKPASKSAKSAPSRLRPSFTSSQPVKCSALIPLMRSIARRSSSTAATRSSRDPVRCVSAIKARSAFLGAAIFEKSGVDAKPALRGRMLMRFASFFHSPRPRYSRSTSF